jgi:hypothetical protein
MFAIVTAKKNRLRLFALGAALLLAIAAGCSSSVPQPPEFDRTVNFGRYWVYAWTGQPRRMSRDLELLDWRIRTAVDGQLALKGRRKQVSGEKPDFLVAYRLAVEEGTINTFRDWFEYRAAGGAGSPSEAYTQGFEQASLVLEMFDPVSRQLVWRASAKAIIDTENVHKQNERVDAAVRRMLTGFPPVY